MAARIKKYHQDEVRAKIQASQLINRLQDHGMGKVEMQPSQVKAIEILLRKTIPDLTAIQHQGDPDNPMHMKIEQVIVDTKG